MAGFYRSSYIVNGKTKYMASTKFEPTHARKAFPCWDEPNFKTSYEISVVADSYMEVISNMNVVEKHTENDKKTLWKFAPTPLCSSYLVAVVIGEFDTLFNYTKRGIKVGIYTPVGCVDQGLFALDVATRCLDFYEDFYGLKFPLPKCDFLAISNFASGAMENWGCITFRETALLVDIKNSGIAKKQRVCECVTHELAHQV